MFFNCREMIRWVWASAFSIVLLSQEVLFPSPVEARVFFNELMSQQVNAQPQRLNPPRMLLTSERASAAMVGTIMSLLATFEEAGVLPSEGTAQADQVIHSLIQVQSAFMKSPSPELVAYWEAAAVQWTSQRKEQGDGLFRQQGLTDRMLAALVAYDLEHPLWENPEIISVMQRFHVTRAGWVLIAELFKKADAVFGEQGRSIHMVYESLRKTMTGGKS